MEFKQLLINLEIDIEPLLHRFSNNEQLLKRFLCKFTQDQTFSSLEAACRDMEFQDIEKKAHSLKGIASNLGFSKLALLCHEIIEVIRSQYYDGVDKQFELIQKEYRRIVGELECYMASI